MGARHTVSMADPAPVRWSAMPPLPPHSSQSVGDVCRCPYEGMWRALEAVMGRLPGDNRQKEMARNISGLPMRMVWGFVQPEDPLQQRTGILGGLPVHVAEEAPRGDHTHHEPVGHGSRRPRVSG